MEFRRRGRIRSVHIHNVQYMYIRCTLIGYVFLYCGINELSLIEIRNPTTGNGVYTCSNKCAFIRVC